MPLSSSTPKLRISISTIFYPDSQSLLFFGFNLIIMNKMESFAFPIFVFVVFALLNLVYGQDYIAPSPVAEGPVSDGTAIDQGIAYILLFVALAVTYLFR